MLAEKKTQVLVFPQGGFHRNPAKGVPDGFPPERERKTFINSGRGGGGKGFLGLGVGTSEFAELPSEAS